MSLCVSLCHLIIFNSNGDRHHYRFKGRKFWSVLGTYGRWAVRVFSACHTNCDIWHPFICMVISKDPWQPRTPVVERLAVELSLPVVFFNDFGLSWPRIKRRSLLCDVVWHNFTVLFKIKIKPRMEKIKLL